MPEYITRLQLAKLLGVSRNTLRRWTREGKLPHVKISEHTIRYRREDVEKLLQSQNA